jgi:RNA polymerase-binding transcription factor
MKAYISDTRRETLRQLLQGMREREVNEIEKQLGRELDIGMARKIDAAMDVGDWASLDLAEGVDHTILEMRYRTYKEIAGTYGVCESCGGEIPVDRLTAEPFARYCVPCLTRMEALERVEKEIGRPSTL